MTHGRFPSGASLAFFETLDSTSREAGRRAAVGARGPLWILALEQTAGYGRRDTQWIQAPGDVAATLLFDPDAAPERLGELSFVGALAVADAIFHFAPGAPVTLKWPNDVLIGGGKVAGLLLELIDRGNGPLIAFGVGVNIVSKPEAADYPTARLIDFAPVAPTPMDFVTVLDGAFEAWAKRWREDGFEPIRAGWLERASSRGGKIRVRLPNETVEGVFTDLDPEGALVLDCADGRRLIRAGAIIRS